jgi:hypothetical protein
MDTKLQRKFALRALQQRLPPKEMCPGGGKLFSTHIAKINT